MRQLIERVRMRLGQFVAQRDHLALVVSCSDSDAAVVHKMLEGLDEASNSEVFWLVVDEFSDAASFVEACVQSFSTKHTAVRLAMKKKGLPVWPPLPSEISQAGVLPPLERLKQLVIFSRSLLPVRDGVVVVWGLLPFAIQQLPAYADFMASLWQHEYPFPWCHHVRFILRDQFPNGSLLLRAREAVAVDALEVDLSAKAIREAMEAEAGDDAAPLADRINNVLMLAGMDYAHCHYDRALRQYDLVHRYALGAKNPTLAAVALNGMGEVHRAQGQREWAGDFFQAAVAPAVQAPGPPVPILFNVYSNLGQLRLEQERWEEAEVYLQGAADFALLLRDPPQRLHFWNLLGQVQYRQSKTGPALETWFNGAVVAGKLRQEGQQRGFVEQLRKHYEQQHDEPGLREILRKIQDAIAADTSQHPVVSGRAGESS